MIRLTPFLVLFLISGCSRKEPEPIPVPMPYPVTVVPSPSPQPSVPNHPVTVIQAENGQKYYTGLIHKDPALQGLGEIHMAFADGECDNLPDEFDLRTLGLVPPVRDQGSCGSCWAFSETAALESAMLGVGKSLNLSEQELVSCDRENAGCNGGNMNGFSYQIQHGQGLESDFPYTARDVRCKAIPVAAKGISFQIAGSNGRSPTEKEIRCALYKYRTVPWITVSADNDWGSPPSSENTMWTRCGSGETNHAIGTVGWKKNGNKFPLIAKNSWGLDWADKGYALIPTGCDSFGDEVGFIQVEVPPTPTPPPGPSPTPIPPTPTPDPCVPPNIKLPKIVLIDPGQTVTLMPGSQTAPANWTYEWFTGTTSIGKSYAISVTPSEDTIYKLVATSSCGHAESSVKVTLVQTRIPTP